MFTRMLRPLSVCGILVLYATGGIASAHWGPVDPCNACVATPAACGPACAPVCAQPVACYQTVPVTEYREVRQTVRRPVCETAYVDQPCTEYRPVVEQCTVNVPTCTYEDVIECRTVCRDVGGWVTRYTPICKMSPCDYDNRPGLGGWLNRTAYSVRASFTPDAIAHREYVPNVVTQTVPVRHRVAKHGVRQVTYNVTRMVAHTTTRKVAVNTVRYVDEQVVAMQPVTVMRTVPIGTALAYGVPAGGLVYGAAPTRSALAPQPDPVSGERIPRRADASDDRFRNREAPAPDAPRPNRVDPTSFDRPFDRPVERESTRLPGDHDHDHGLDDNRRAASPGGARNHHAARPVTGAAAARFEPTTEPTASGETPRSVPSIVRVGQWTARRPSTSEGPEIVRPGVSVADRSLIGR
ncbi:MAG: hypothetical protein WD066_04205 [Planctomycetaceae bacterium]